MVHRPADSRLLTNLLQHEKEYSKQLNQLLDTSSASLASFAAYAAASPPPASQVIMAIAGTLAAADEALKRYRQGVEEWRDNMRMLKEMEDEVGNIMRDREILVNRLIKASKSQKQSSSNIRDSLLLGHQPFPSSSTLSLQDSPSPPPSRPLSSSFSSSTKLAAAQSELQACETHLAAKERELAAKRSASVRDGLGARARAMIECGWAWSQLGKEALRTLETLREQDRPASDVSSVGPSQSASQINHHNEAGAGAAPPPPPPPISSIMNSSVLGDLPPPPPPPAPPPLSVDPRPPSGTTTTTTSSLFYTPATPATYKLETVTYAPAVALHVPPSTIHANVNASPGAGAGTGQASPFAPVTSEIRNDDSTHRNVHLPAPHALDGYAYDIPMAEPLAPVAAVAGPSRAYSPVKGARRQGSSSGYSTPTRQGSPFASRRVLERRITEEELRRPNPEIQAQEEEEEEGSTEEDESRLVSGGKLAVVENPRFVSEARKRELEKEREKAEKEKREEAEGERKRAEEAEREKRRKEEEEERRKGKQKEEEEERVGEPVKEKSRFSLRPQRHHASESGHPEESPTKPDIATSSPSKPTPNTSPSKGLFGTLRGLFGKHPSPKKARSGTITADDADVSSDSDDDTTASPSKRGGLFRARWKGHAKSKSSVSPSKWESRTEKNVRQLLAETPRGASFDGDAGRGVVGGGSSRAGGGGSAVHLGAGQESRRPMPRMRSVSDTGVVGASSAGGGRRLKKTRTGPPVAASAAAAATAALSSSSTPGRIPTRSASLSTSAAPQPRPSARTTAMSNEMTPTGKRRSASIDIAVENRRSFIEEEMERDSSGGEMIVDLGKRRRRAASEIGGGSTSPTTPVRAQMGPIPTAPAPVLVSREAAKQQMTAAPAPAPAPMHVKGYSSDTAAVAPLASMKKKSLTKKKNQAGSTPTPPPPAPATSSSAPPPPPAATSTPAKKLSTKSPKSSGGAMASKTSLARPSGTTTTIAIGPLTTATVLPATGGTPSGTLVPQEGWAAQSQAPGGSLSRNSSILSAASAPPGTGGSGPVKGKKQKRTTLGQGMGNSTGGGLARHASLGSAPAPALAPSSHVSTTQPDTTMTSTSTSAGGGVVHPAAVAPSLMSIVEDVARGNREGWGQGQDMRKSVGGSQIPSGLVEVVKAPPRLTRDELDRIGSLEVKVKGAAGASAGAGPAGPSGPNLFQIKAPGSVFDVRQQQQQQQSVEAEGAEAPKTAKIQRSTSVQDKGKRPIRGSSAPASNTTGANSNVQPAAVAAAVKMPLRSALRNPSPSPSPQPHLYPHPHPHPQPGPSILHYHPSPAPKVIADIPSHIPGSLSSPQNPEPTVKRDKGKGKAPPPQEDSANESSADDTGNEIFYSDEEEVERVSPPAPLVPLSQPVAKGSTSTPGQELANGHAAGYGSEVSESTASTALASTGQAPNQGPTQTPRRRKSVRVSLQPTFSPSPPAIDYDEEEEARAHAPWAWEQGANSNTRREHGGGGVHAGGGVHVHAPVAVPAAQPKTIAAAIDIWADSSDEDESYARAKRMLSRAAKKEKDVTLMVANRM